MKNIKDIWSSSKPKTTWAGNTQEQPVKSNLQSGKVKKADEAAPPVHLPSAFKIHFDEFMKKFDEGNIDSVALKSLYDICRDNRDHCKMVSKALTQGMTLKEIESIGNELYKFECGEKSNIPFRTNNLAKEFSRLHMKALLKSENKLDSFINDALEAVKNPTRIEKGDEKAFSGVDKKVDVVRLNELNFSDLKRMIEPLHDIIDRILVAQPNSEKKEAFSKIFDFHILSLLIQESQNAKALYSKPEDFAQLLKIRFRINDEVREQLFKEYEKVNLEKMAKKDNAPLAPTKEDAPLSPPKEEPPTSSPSMRKP